jgi:hypothetical protein
MFTITQIPVNIDFRISQLLLLQKPNLISDTNIRRVMAFRERAAVYSENHMKRSVCEQLLDQVMRSYGSLPCNDELLLYCSIQLK